MRSRTYRIRPHREHPSLRPALVFLGIAAGTACLFLALQGCAGWQGKAKTALTVAEATVDGASKAGLDYYQRHCMAVAKACPGGAPSDCKPLVECQRDRRTLQTVLDKATLAISATWLVLAAADESGTLAKLAALAPLLSDLSKLLAGIVPGGVM